LLVLPNGTSRDVFEKSGFVRSPIELQFEDSVREAFGVREATESIVSYILRYGYLYLLIVCRPDLYVGYFGKQFHEDELFGYLERVLL
jgi:hypothetical protein